MTNRSENPREKLYRKMLHGHWVKIVSALASVVVFCTVYALILPAITLSNQEPKCNIAEHTHVAECYDAEGNIVCGAEEHIHNLACYSDLNAAIESEEYWVAELPALTGDRNADVIAVAKSQIGYKENDENYKVVDNEQTKGYTRYGHWYGEEVDTYSERFENGLSDYAYKDWDAMFVSFVLRYAEIYDMGFDSDAGNWAGALGDAAIYVDAANYVPQMGDLIFFTPNVGENMRVGIVSGVNRGFFGNEIKSISVILGDSNNAVEEVKVAVSEYTEGDITFETIHGYGVLTPGYGEQPEAVAEQEAAVENADAAAPAEEAAPEGTDAAAPEGEAVAEAPEAEVVPVSLEENSEHLIGQAEENLETVEEASEGEISVALLDAGISEDGSEIAMNWNMTARLPEAMLPAGSIIRIDTSTGKIHAMTVGQVFGWAQAAGVGIDNAAYVDNDNFEVTFIGDNGLLYSWADVQNMDAAAVTSFTGIHIKALNDVELGEDGAIFFDFASKAKVSDANAGQNYYVSKVSVNGVSGAETYVYTNGEAETVDQNEVLRDAGLEEKPDEEPAEKTLTAKKSDYTVTMTYGPEAAIPDGAKLYVQEIRQGTEEYNRYIEDAKAALGISEEDAAEFLGRFFDIKIMTKEGEFEPKAPVNVNIEYKKAVETEDVSAVSAVHFSEDGTETIPVETVDVSEPEDEKAMVKSVEFSAESFSVYGVVYTVDFETVDGGTYSLPGEGSYKLNELLPFIIGKSGKVSSADLKILEGEEVEGALYLTEDEEGEYWIHSDVAFDDTYQLTVVVDGVKYEIKVTDVPLAGNTTQISANVTNNTTVSYNSSESAYEANVTVKFVIPTDTIKREKTFTMQLGDDIIIPENALNVMHQANDHGAGMVSFDYKFVKGGDGKYSVEITYRDDYLAAVEIIGKNTLALNVLIKESALDDSGNINTPFTDGANITYPGENIQYPGNEDAHNNIYADKSYLGTGTTHTAEGDKTYIDYTVRVSSTKGTKEGVVVSDTLQNINYKINGADNPIAVESVSVQSITKSGSAYSGGTFVPSADNKSFTYTLDRLGANEYYDIVYRYVLDQKLQDHGEPGQDFSMQASGGNTLTATSGGQKTTDGDSFEIKKSDKPVEINKTGQYDGNGKIEWRIVVTLKGPHHTLVDDMLANAQDLTITREGGQGQWSHTPGTDSIVFNQDGTYTITYKTDADPIPYTDRKVTNTAIVDDNPNWKSEVGVPVPHNDEAEITKSLSDKQEIEVIGNIATYKLTWNVIFDLPANGFPAGTVLKDQLFFDWSQHGPQYDRHEFTEEQKAALVSKLEAIFGADAFDVSLNPSNYTLSITFKNDWTNSNNLSSANITYDTTGYVDLNTISVGVSTQYEKDKYANVFSVGDVSARADFAYQKEVNKIDETDLSGNKATEHTVTRDQNELKWAVVLALTDDYYTMEIVDTLPKGVTPYEISIGGEYTSDKWLPKDDGTGEYYRVESFNKYMKETVTSIKATKQADGTTKVVVNIAVDPNNPDARPDIFRSGQYFYTYIRTHVDGSEFDPLENVTKSYMNNVSVTGDGEPLGDDHQTQNTTLDSKSLEKNTIDPEHRWESFHELNYEVYINADGHAIMLDSEGVPIENATYSLDDVLEFKKTSPEGKDINVMLVPGSVKLQTKSGNDWVDYSGDWAYQYIETKEGEKRFKTISLSGIPDQTPLKLVYAYRVDLDGIDPNDESEHDLGPFLNTVTLHGTSDYSYENRTENKWKNFDTTASSESSPTLTLSKVDVDNYNKLLPGTKFILEYWDGNSWVPRNAISQEPMYITDDTPAAEVTKVYVTATSTSPRTNGILKIYQPYSEDYQGDTFDYNTCYRVREYSAPTGYMLSTDPDKQPCGYFWFSHNGSTVDNVTWPNARIKGLADDLSKESDTFFINNAKTATLKINKKFQGDVNLTSEQKAAMRFEVYDNQNRHIVTLTYDDIVHNRNTITDGINEGETYTVIERVVDISGAERVTTYTVNGGSDIEGSSTDDVSASVPIVNGIGSVVFTNNYSTPKTSIKVTKKWLNDDDSENTNPEQTSIKFQVYQLPEGASTGTPYVEHGQNSATEYEITYAEGSWSEVTVDNLPRYADSVNQTGEYRYYAVETDPSAGVVATYKVGDSGTEGSAADAAQTNDTNKIVIVNRDAKITVKKSFKDVFGQTKTDIPDGRTIHFKIVANATQTWDGGKTTQDIGSYTIRYNAAAHEWYKDGTNEVFAMKLPANKMEGDIVKLIYDSYFIVEEQENQFDISYLVNGLPLSNSNPIRNDQNQEITIVNTDKAPEGEIIVRKEWMDINGQPEEAPVDSIDIKIKQVPIPIEGKGEPASIFFFSEYNQSINFTNNDYKVGDIITVNYGSDYCGGVTYEGCTKLDGGQWGQNLSHTLLITSSSVRAKVQLSSFTETNLALSGTQLPTGTKEVTRELLKNPTNPDAKHPQAWVYKDRLEELFGPNPDVSLFRYQVEESGLPSDYKVTYTYGTSVDEDTMTGVVNQGLITLTNAKVPPTKGSLKLTKEVTVNGGSAETAAQKALVDGDYTFSIVGPAQVPAEDQVTKYVRITVNNGTATSYRESDNAIRWSEPVYDQWAVVTDLLAGDYTITELTPTNGTAVSKINGSPMTNNYTTVTVVAGDSEATEASARATFTNNINTGDLKIEKKVTGTIATDKEFEFEVTLSSPTGTELTFATSYSAKKNGHPVPDVNVSGNKVTGIKLMANETFEILGLPEGTVYTVTEKTPLPQGYSEGTHSNNSGTIKKEPEQTATMNNKYEATGRLDFSAKKVFENGDLETQSFSFKLTQVTGQNVERPETDTTKLLLATNPVTKTTAATSGTQQTVSFDTINLLKNDTKNQEGEYWFLLEEVLPSDLDSNNVKDGIKYDTTKKWIKVTVTDNGAEVLNVVKDPNVATDEPDGIFTNTKLKDFVFQKEWYSTDDPVNPITEWPDGKEITVTVHRKVGDTVDNSFALTYTIKKTDLVNNTEIAGTNANDPKLVVTDAAAFKFKLSNLEFSGTIGSSTPEATGEYTYYVTETQVEDYKEPEYKTGTVSTTDGAHDGGKIINRPDDAVTLPETGGIGTMTYRAAGLILIVLALIGIYLNKRRGRWCDG